MRTQVKEVEQPLSRAQNGKAEAEQQAAMEHLRQVQAEQTDKPRETAS